MMGIHRLTYHFICEKRVQLGEVSLSAVKVKHAEDISCFGYILQNGTACIYYSGDSYEVPEVVQKEFFVGNSQQIYQDTTEYPSDHLSHCPLEDLEKLFPMKVRDRVFCMHFTTDFRKKIVEKGFSCVQVDGDFAH